MNTCRHPAKATATLQAAIPRNGSEFVKLRIFPREEPFFDLFEAAGDNLADAAHEGDRLTHAILSRLNSTFITPFDREDIYALAGNLDDVVDSLEAAADMMVLHRVTEPIDAVVRQSRLVCTAAEETATGLKHLRHLDREPLRAFWIRINELENEGDRLYRHARADLYSFDAEHPAQFLLRWKDIVDEIEQALDELEHVAHTVESIVLKNA